MITSGQTYPAPSLKPLSFVMQAKPSDLAKANVDIAKSNAVSVAPNSAEDYTKALTVTSPLYGINDDESARLIKPLPLTEVVTGQLTALYNTSKPDTGTTETVDKSV